MVLFYHSFIVSIKRGIGHFEKKEHLSYNRIMLTGQLTNPEYEVFPYEKVYTE